MLATSAIGRGGPAHYSDRGFTLLELVVVMAILAMIAAFLPLALDRMLPARRMEAALVRVRAALREAQELSVSTGRRITVEVTPHGLNPPRPLRTMSLSSSISMEFQSIQGSSLPSVTFFADGSAQGGRLILQDGKRDGTVLVSNLTGRIFTEQRHR